MRNPVTMNCDGSDLKQLTSRSRNNDWPDRSPDGRKLAVVRSFRNGDRPVMVVYAHGGSADCVDDPTDATAQRVPAWQPR